MGVLRRDRLALAENVNPPGAGQTERGLADGRQAFAPTIISGLVRQCARGLGRTDGFVTAGGEEQKNRLLGWMVGQVQNSARVRPER